MTSVNYWMSCFVFGQFIVLLTGCGGDDRPAGGSASLSWNPVAESNVHYTVHYGKQSSGGDGSCIYETSIDVSEPYALITGLEFGTQYYFAVSASSEQGSSRCSSEASKLMPEEPPMQIGDPPVDVTAPSPQCNSERGKSNNDKIKQCSSRED